MIDKYLQTIAHALILVAIMLGLIAAALWLRLDSAEPRAEAQTGSRYAAAAGDGAGIPDAGRQRQLTVDLLDAINKRLADIERGLRDGSFAVQVTDAKAGSKQAGRAPAKETEP
jgi:hypothetical protein